MYTGIYNHRWIGTAGISFIGGWFLGGYYHSRSVTKKLNTKFKKDQKDLYQQYYNDVYSLQQQNNELINALEQYIAMTQTGIPNNSHQKQIPQQQQQQQRRVK